jgi:hypothetical protein
MSLSYAAKQNIAFSALESFLGSRDNLFSTAEFVAENIIEVEIGFSGEDVNPGLFIELVSLLTFVISLKLSELSQ